MNIVRKNGMAQIPLLLVLLVLAISLPVATALVKKNTDNRGRASGCNERCDNYQNDGKWAIDSCHPADGNGDARIERCSWKGRPATCGPDFTPYCCADDGAQWSKTITDDCREQFLELTPTTSQPTPTPTTSQPTPTPTTPQPTLTPIVYDLKFMISYPGVLTGAKCANNWPITVTVLAADGTKKVFDDVVPERISGSTSNGLAKYKISLDMAGFNKTSGLSVFVRSSKHLQTKYGKNGQNNYYSQPGGTLNLTSNVVFDFTGYPVLAGDVNEDNVVDGQDFSKVKTASISRSTVSDGGNMAEDLNGNCVMESQDLGLLMITLNQKQDQLY